MSQSGESVEPYAYIKIDEKGEETDFKICQIEVIDEIKFNLSKEVPLEFEIDIKNPNLQNDVSTMDYSCIYHDDLERGVGDIIPSDQVEAPVEEATAKICTTRLKVGITLLVLAFVLFLLLVGTITAVSTILSVNN